MNADRIQIQEGPSRVFQNRKGESTQLMEDNRVQSALQAKMVETMQRDAMDEDDFLRDGFLLGTCTSGFIERAGGWGFGIYARYGYPFRPGTIQTGYVCRTAAIGT